MRGLTQKHGCSAPCWMSALVLVLVGTLAVWCTALPAKQELGQASVSAKQAMKPSEQMSSAAANSGAFHDGTPSNNEQSCENNASINPDGDGTPSGEEASSGEQAGSNTQPDDAVREPTVELALEGEGVREESTLYAQEDLVLGVRIGGYELNMERTTVLGQPLATVLAMDEASHWTTTRDEDGRTTIEGSLQLGEGSYEVEKLCEVCQQDGTQAQSRLVYEEVELTTVVVDTCAPVVTQCTVSAKPKQCCTLGENEFAFFSEPFELAFELEDKDGVRSATLEHSDGTQHMLALSEEGATAVVSVTQEAFTSASRLVIADYAGNETEWSLCSEGVMRTATGAAPCKNEPLCIAETHEVVGSEGHPHALVLDSEAPRVTIEGVQEDSWSNAPIALNVRVQDASLGYGALVEPGRTIAALKKDDKVVATIPATFEGATAQDQEHVYTLMVPAHTTHEDDGTYCLEASFEDLAGNASTTEYAHFRIDTTAPTLSVAFDDSDEALPTGLYAHARTAHLCVRDASFTTELLCSSTAPLAIGVAAYDGRTVDEVKVSPWQADEKDPHTFTCDVSFPPNGSYDLRVQGHDVAGNLLEGATGTPVSSEGMYETGRFTIDTEQPRLELAYAEQAPRPHTFKGTDYFKDPVSVVLTLCDRNPDLEQTCVTTAEGKQIELVWNVQERDEHGVIACTATFELKEDGVGRKQLAALSTDCAGNASSVQMDPFVIDQTPPVVEHVALNVSPTTVGAGSAAGEDFLFFSAQVPNEPQLAFTCSDEFLVDAAWLTDPEGVYENVAERMHGTNQGSFAVPLLDRAQREDDRNTAFRKNVRVMVRDMAGNVCSWGMEHGAEGENAPLEGDVAHPCELVYDATSPQVFLAGAEAGSFVQEPVTVRVDVQERNMAYLQRFDPERVVATVHKVAGDAGAEQSSERVAVSSLESSEAGYSCEKTLAADGHYTVQAQLTDFAGNASDAVELSTFTVDTTPPRIVVSWDHSEVHNEKYYNHARTATVQVHEHNFDEALVTLQTTGQVSGWISDGDNHSCTVVFTHASTAAAPHTLSVQARDKAGNEATPVTEENFVLDTTRPQVSVAKRASTDDPYVVSAEVSELVDGSAFAGALEPLVTFEDEEGLDEKTVEVSLVGKRAGTASAPSFAEHREARSNTSLEVRWDNLGFTQASDSSYEVAADDVYVLRAQVTDKAGNVSEERAVTFSLNRYGSNFFVESVGDLCQDHDGAWPDALLTTSPRIVIREVNVSGAASELEGEGQSAHTVTKEYARATHEIARVEAEGTTGYVLESSTTHNDCNPYEGWSSYTYVISSGNFGAGSDCDFGDGGQGHYRVNVRSVDKAHNSNTTNDYWSSDAARAEGMGNKDASVSFTLDERGPELEDVTLPAAWSVGAGFEASFYLKDQITNGDHVRVLVDGKPVRVWWTETGEELHENTSVTHEGRLSFEVAAQPAFVPRSIAIYVSDYTGLPERAAELVQQGFVRTTLMAEGSALLAGIVLAVIAHKVMKALHTAAPHKRRDGKYDRTN